MDKDRAHPDFAFMAPPILLLQDVMLTIGGKPLLDGAELSVAVTSSGVMGPPGRSGMGLQHAPGQPPCAGASPPGWGTNPSPICSAPGRTGAGAPGRKIGRFPVVTPLADLSMPLKTFALRPLIAAGAVACGLIAPTWAQTPPPAPSQPVTETFHGVTLVDPYRNLETRSPETLAWMRAQAAYASQTLDAIPVRQPPLQRIEQLARTKIGRAHV